MNTLLFALSIFFLVFGIILDSATTIVALQKPNFREKNPLYHLLGSQNFWLLKFFLNLGVAITGYVFYWYYGKWYILLGLWFVAGFQMFSGARNLYLLLTN
jgi:hypothetical protein